MHSEREPTPGRQRMVRLIPEGTLQSLMLRLERCAHVRLQCELPECLGQRHLKVRRKALSHSLHLCVRESGMGTEEIPDASRLLVEGAPGLAEPVRHERHSVES